MKAAASLSDITQQWTTPNLIQIFQATLWPEDVPNDVYANRDNVDDRLKSLIRILGATRDPRVAGVLIRTMDYPNLGIRWAAASAFSTYFMAPCQDISVRISSNVMGDEFRRVHEWWAIHRGELETAAERGTN